MPTDERIEMDTIKIEDFSEYMDSVMEEKWVDVDTPYFSFKVRPIAPYADLDKTIKAIVDGCFFDETDHLMHPLAIQFGFRFGVIDLFTNIELPSDAEKVYRICFASDLFDTVCKYVDADQLSEMRASIYRMVDEVSITRRNIMNEALSGSLLSSIQNFEAKLHDIFMAASTYIEENIDIDEVVGVIQNALNTELGSKENK